MCNARNTKALVFAVPAQSTDKLDAPALQANDREKRGREGGRGEEDISVDAAAGVATFVFHPAKEPFSYFSATYSSWPAAIYRWLGEP